MGITDSFRGKMPARNLELSQVDQQGLGHSDASCSSSAADDSRCYRHRHNTRGKPDLDSCSAASPTHSGLWIQ